MTHPYLVKVSYNVAIMSYESQYLYETLKIMIKILT